MSHDCLALNDPGRLRLLGELLSFQCFDNATCEKLLRLLQLQLDCTACVISVVDDKQTKVLVQLGVAWTTWPREISFCAHTVVSADVLVVPDSALDSRFATHTLGLGLGPSYEAQPARFYAGAPIFVEGYVVGAVGALGLQPSKLSAQNRQTLLDVAGLLGQMLGAALSKNQYQIQFEQAISNPQKIKKLALVDSLCTEAAQGLEELLGYTNNQVSERKFPVYPNHLKLRAPSQSPFKNASYPISAVLQDLSPSRPAQLDITEKLHFSEALYKSVALSISDGVLIITPALVVIAANPSACKTLGASEQSLENAQGLWPFEFLGEHLNALRKEESPVQKVIVSRQALLSKIYALRRPDGQLRWVELSAHPLRLHPKNPNPSVVLTFKDITEQRFANQALSTAEERWKFALEGSGDGVWDWNTQTNKVFYSARWKMMMGYAESEIGDSVEEWTSRIHPDDLPRMMTELRQHLRGETPLYQSEHRVRHRNGTDLWILDRGRVVSTNAHGRPVRMVGTHSDITAAKRAEQALREKQTAEMANQAKTQFLSRMSHEMRTPLNAVIGFSQLMRMRMRTNSQHTANSNDYADHIFHAGQHLLALINDVLDLQKVEEGRLSLDIGTVDLTLTISSVIELLSPEAKERRVYFEKTLRSSVWVKADAQRLRQVLINMVSNAVKYNLPGGTVRFSLTDQQSGRLKLCIQDGGAGMNEAQMRRLFHPFDRLGQETSNIEGTGLGLIIARSLMQAIGGNLEVQSSPGRGTRVYIELLRDKAPNPQADSIPECTDNIGTVSTIQTPLRMLYVEDNKINAILFESALGLHQNQVELRIAEDGEQALAIATDWLPEVLVLDAHLPGMTGFDVLRLLRAVPGLSTVPAYMCSADAMAKDVQRAYEAGFVGYWTKPIDITAVLSDIDALAARLRSPS
jgi:PAS domain S-box-containing protein